ncbi:hypothetical protein AQ939_09040 [Burkholderia pseudomallei]|nr:hypothetical protein AQ939_09040 [Burkholderia pseudomallei]
MRGDAAVTAPASKHAPRHCSSASHACACEPFATHSISAAKLPYASNGAAAPARARRRSGHGAGVEACAEALFERIARLRL